MYPDSKLPPLGVPLQIPGKGKQWHENRGGVQIRGKNK